MTALPWLLAIVLLAAVVLLLLPRGWRRKGIDATVGVALWAIGSAIGFLVPGTVAGLIAITCFQLVRGAAFTQAAVRMALTTAVVVLAGGIVGSVLSQFGGAMVAHELLTVTGAQGPALADGRLDLSLLLPQAATSFTIPLWPIGAGFGFAALAAVLKYGAVLQRDTEGLV